MEMSELKFCRICLDNNVRMHQITGSEVQDVYEKLINKKIQEDGMMYFACYICYCQLKNCQRLAIKSQKSEELLKQIVPICSELNLKSIASLDRLAYGLVNPMMIYNVESLQIPVYDVLIKTENNDEGDNYEVIVKHEPDDDSMPFNEIPMLEEKYNLELDEAECIDNGKKENISGTETNIEADENTSSQVVCDEESPQVFVVSEKEAFICNDCGKTCDTKSVLIKHINATCIKTENSLSEGNLPECGKLKKGYRSCDRPLKCQYCNHTFKYNSHLKEHIKIHTGKNDFKCPYCTYTCVKNGNLTRHIRTHTGEKPFKCQYCSYTCTENVTLKTHIRAHTGEKPFKCQFCDYTCRSSGYLKKHMRTHSGEKPYKCQYCSYTCKWKGSLNIHVRTHTGEKPYKCQYCNYMCIENGSLKAHIRTHTGEKPYKCVYCNYACKKNCYLKKHIKIHTEGKTFKS